MATYKMITLYGTVEHRPKLNMNENTALLTVLVYVFLRNSLISRGAGVAPRHSLLLFFSAFLRGIFKLFF